MPVIGLTLPLISYGGSSVVTIFAMLGLVSGAYARPQSLSHERYPWLPFSPCWGWCPAHMHDHKA